MNYSHNAYNIAQNSSFWYAPHTGSMVRWILSPDFPHILLNYYVKFTSPNMISHDVS